MFLCRRRCAEALAAGVRRYNGYQWSAVAKIVGRGRTGDSCRLRWRRRRQKEGSAFNTNNTALLAAYTCRSYTGHSETEMGSRKRPSTEGEPTGNAAKRNSADMLTKQSRDISHARVSAPAVTVLKHRADHRPQEQSRSDWTENDDATLYGTASNVLHFLSLASVFPQD